MRKVAAAGLGSYRARNCAVCVCVWGSLTPFLAEPRESSRLRGLCVWGGSGSLAPSPVSSFVGLAAVFWASCRHPGKLVDCMVCVFGGSGSLAPSPDVPRTPRKLKIAAVCAFGGSDSVHLGAVLSESGWGRAGLRNRHGLRKPGVAPHYGIDTDYGSRCRNGLRIGHRAD